MPYQIKIHRLSYSLLPKYAQFWCVHGNYPIATLHAAKKLRTKGTALAVPHRVKLMRALSP
jgi:hypothetical protein